MSVLSRTQVGADDVRIEHGQGEGPIHGGGGVSRGNRDRRCGADLCVMSSSRKWIVSRVLECNDVRSLVKSWPGWTAPAPVVMWYKL